MDLNLVSPVVPPVDNDSEILAAPALAMRYETLVRVSRAVAAHGDLYRYVIRLVLYRSISNSLTQM
jgi:hypothetical protein